MPPGSGWASNSVHAWPFWSRYQAAARPAGPAATMAPDLPVTGARGATEGTAPAGARCAAGRPPAGGRPGRPGAPVGSRSAGSGRARGQVGNGAGAVAIGRVAMQRADGQALVEVAAPARLFAEARAEPPQRAGQCQGAANHPHGLARVPDGYSFDELRDIQTGRALGRTGRNTLAGM